MKSNPFLVSTSAKGASGALPRPELLQQAFGKELLEFGPACFLADTRGEIELHYQRTPQVEIAGRVAPYDGRVHLDLAGEERYEICYRNNLVAFLDAIRNDSAPLPDAVDGARALDMVLAAYRADREGRSVEIAAPAVPA